MSACRFSSIRCAGASPAKIDSVLKKELGLAMGIFEMFDLAGIDIGWRQRTELGLTDPKSRDPSKRYSSLMDKLCEQGECFGVRAASLVIKCICDRFFRAEDRPWMV